MALAGRSRRQAISRGKRHAAPAAARLKSASLLNVERCADGITSRVGPGCVLPRCKPDATAAPLTREHAFEFLMLTRRDSRTQMRRGRFGS